jgi:hypothetical protein
MTSRIRGRLTRRSPPFLNYGDVLRQHTLLLPSPLAALWVRRGPG